MLEKGNGAASSTPVLVVGATGYLGSHILTHLREKGYPVRALARNLDKLSAEQKRGVDIFVGQVTRPDTLHGLCDEISVVVSSLGKRSLTRKPTSWEVDYQGNLNVLRLAQAAGVRHFIFIGVLHGELWRSSIPFLEPRERFIDELRSSGLDWTVLNPPGAFNDMGSFLQQAQRGRVFLVGSGQARINPIHPMDLASEVARCIEDPAARNRVYDIGGPEIFSYAEIEEMAFKALGTRPHTTHIAPGLVSAVGQVIKPFNPSAAGALSFFRQVMTTDMVGACTGQFHLSDFFAQLANQYQALHKEEVKKR